MESLFNDLVSFLLRHLAVVSVASGVVALGTITAYTRNQIQAAIIWALQPITSRLPWNKYGHSERLLQAPTCLRSELTVIDLSLLASDGREATYRKTSDYVVTCDEVHSYNEGVTAVGRADQFDTTFGLIVRTVQEHGFFVSTIDIGNGLGRGARFTNVYSARLRDSFTSNHEYWTQEIVWPTSYVVLRVHFPAERAPILITCKLLDGFQIKHLNAAIQMMESEETKTVVWNIPSPRLRAIYKIEWRW